MQINLTLLASLFFMHTAFASQTIDTNPEGIAFYGYDPVSYHTTGQPTLGKSQFKVIHASSTLQFSSEENRQLFIANEDSYLPAYGGFCAYGVRVGKKFNGDPKAWVINNGQLYFFLNSGTKKVWSKNERKNIDISDRLWKKVKYAPLSKAN